MRVKFVAAATSLALAITASASPASADVQPNLVGGHAATVPTPWMVSIQYTAPTHGVTKARHMCGGALVFRTWVVTNGHCVSDEPGAGHIPVSDIRLSVRVGSHDRTKGGETAKVKRIVVNPGWAWGAPNPPSKCEVDLPAQVPAFCDIAMLELDHAVKAQPIQLAPDAAQPGDVVQLFGWGDDTPDTKPTLPTQLQQLEAGITEPDDCVNAGQLPDEICTDNPNGTDGPGAGDSGGPAVKYVRGVPQLVGGCSRAAAQYPGEKPTVYVSSPSYRNWIYRTARGVAAGI